MGLCNLIINLDGRFSLTLRNRNAWLSCTIYCRGIIYSLQTGALEMAVASAVSVAIEVIFFFRFLLLNS
jgi:hypothetical protein